MKNILIILFLFLSSVVKSQTTYYVSATGGNNANAGTSGSPWATLSYAVTRVTSGDIIYMQAGTHTINSQVALPLGVSLTGAGESSVITSTSITAEWSEIISMESATISNGNQTISYLKFDGNNLIAAQALDIKRRHNVKIHHCTFVNFHYVAVVWLGDGGFVGGDPYDKAYPPTNYVTGSEFHDNTVTNCSLYTSFGYGALWLGGQDGMLVYNNSIIQNQRPSGSNGYCIKTYGGWMRGCKIYNNTLLTAGNEWLFAIEGFFFMGVEIYNNTITGAIDVNFSWRGDNNEYDYGVWIHNNILGPTTTGSSNYCGIILEFKVEDEIIERNLFRNNGVGIHHTMRYPYPWVYREKIRYNIFYNSGVGSYHSCIRFGETGNNFDIDDLEIYNNVFHTEASGGQYFGLHIRGFNTAKNVKVRNNIFMNFSYYWFDSNRGDYFDYLYIENNILYNNASSNNLTLGGTPSHYTNSGNKIANPNFTNAADGDFTLLDGSPAIDAGMPLGLLSDYAGNTVGENPDIGAYEFGSNDAPPIYVSSVIENSTPSLLEMTYNMGLANVVPAATAFNVMVNSVQRPVNVVTVSGTKVRLTLSSPVVSGNVVTVAYAKPSTNPLQTVSGVQLAGITAQSVINNCNKPPVVIITSPVKSSLFVVPATIVINANAYDPDGTISKVEFFSNSVKIGETTISPYEITWKNVPSGTYSLTAVATDNKNAASASQATIVEVSVITSEEFVNQGNDKKNGIIELYPNPNNGRFSIRLYDSDQGKNGLITIYDLAGKVVFKEILSSGENIKQFDLSFISSGIYIIKIDGEAISSYKKFYKN